MMLDAKPTKRELLEHWLETIEHEGVNLTAWEEEFIGSMRARVDLGQAFTDKQAEILERIYAERTS